MPDISIQLYATPAELLAFVKEVMQDFSLHAVAMRFRPFEAQEVDHADLDSYFSDSSKFHRWAFTVHAPHLPVEHELDHADKNPDHLRLEVGKCNSIGLEESWLSCRTGNETSFGIWKKIASRLKKQTKQGVTAVNRQTGVSAYYKSSRYTDGAKSLEDGGVRMLPPQGQNGPRIILGTMS